MHAIQDFNKEIVQKHNVENWKIHQTREENKNASHWEKGKI